MLYIRLICGEFYNVIIPKPLTSFYVSYDYVIVIVKCVIIMYDKMLNSNSRS